MPYRPLATKDNAVGRLNAGISAGVAAIPLQAGQGANFPAATTGSATSGGSSTTLNDTGIAAQLSADGVVVGDLIENTTDGSYAVILSISTNSITTTPLVGGTDNTWQNADVWAANRFVATLIQYDTDGVTILKREKVLISSRTGDTMEATLARGYDGTTAQSFLTGDYVYLFATSAQFKGINQAINDLTRTVETLDTRVDNKVTQTGAELHAVSAAGSDAYVGVYSPVITSYTDGMILTFEADVNNAGNATFNAGGGAYNILKNFNQTLATDDIKAGQKVIVQWDASNSAWQMQSQVGNDPTTGTDFTKTSFTAGEDLAIGDHVGITAADTIKRYSPTALPSSFDQSAENTGACVPSNTARAAVVVDLSTTLKAFVYDDLNVATPGMAVTKIPITPSTGAVGTVSFLGNIIAGFTPPTTIDAVKMDTDRVLMVEAKSNAFSYVVGSMASFTMGTSASIDTSNVESGFCEYISDSHVLFFSKDTSASSIQFYKYTASGMTLSASSTGTVATLAGKTFTLKGVRRFGTTNYFLFIVQNDTDGTAQAIIAEYNTGSSTFSTVGATTNFTGSQQLYNAVGSQAVMVNLDDTHILVHCPTSATNSVTFLVSRSNSTSTTPVFSAFSSYTSGSNAGYSATKVNSRCALTVGMNGTTATVTLWEVDSAGTGLTSRVTQTHTSAPAGSTMMSNGLAAAFSVSPVRMGFIGFDDTADDLGVGTGTYTLPAPAGITSAAISNGNPGVVITGGLSDDVSGLTAASKYYADLGGLLTTDSNGSPDKVGATKDATELIVKSW